MEFLQNAMFINYTKLIKAKDFANEHMTTTKSKITKSHPYGFLYVHFCIGNCNGTRVLEKFSSLLQLLTELPISCPCPFSLFGCFCGYILKQISEMKYVFFKDQKCVSF